MAILTKLQNRVREELDKRLPPAPALLRRLLRMDDSEARRALLKEKMAPKQVSKIQIAGVGGETQEPEDPKPDVPPKEMAEAIKEIKMRFGNVDENYDSVRHACMAYHRCIYSQWTSAYVISRSRLAGLREAARDDRQGSRGDGARVGRRQGARPHTRCTPTPCTSLSAHRSSRAPCVAQARSCPLGSSKT